MWRNRDAGVRKALEATGVTEGLRDVLGGPAVVDAAAPVPVPVPVAGAGADAGADEGGRSGSSAWEEPQQP